jgi:polyisoprenoid-binding protein YceI
MKTWVKVLIGVIVAAVVAVVAIPFVYINFIKDDPPKKLSIEDAPVTTDSATSVSDSADPSDTTITSHATDATAPATSSSPSDDAEAASSTSGADGTYSVTADSVVGYRVVEVLFGQDTEGVGRTNSITGSLTISGTQVTDAEFTVDMSTLQSDESRRDSTFRNEIMETAQFPTGTFVITAPIELGSIPTDGEEITATATGELTLHGVTQPVTIEVTAKKTGDSIAVSGSTDIKFSDYNIDNPSRTGVTTQDHGLLEFLLVFVKG